MNSLASYIVIEADDILSNPLTGLLEAIEKDDVERVRRLLDSVDLDAPVSLAVTHPLIQAISARNERIVQLMLARKPRLDPRVRDVAYGGGVLHWAAATGQEVLLEQLLTQMASTTQESFQKLTPLHAAASYGHCGCLRLLLHHNADPNAADERGSTALHEAAAWGHTRVARELLSSQANVDAVDREQETPLLLASRRGFPSLVQALLEAGADLERGNAAGVTALAASSFFGHESVVRMLLSRGANRRTADRQRRRTPLHYAAMNDYPMVAEALLEGHSDIMTALDVDLRSPLDLAEEADAMSVLSLLR